MGLTTGGGGIFEASYREAVDDAEGLDGWLIAGAGLVKSIPSSVPPQSKSTTPHISHARHDTIQGSMGVLK